MQNSPQVSTRFLSLKEVQHRIGYSTTSIWRLRKIGKFPAAVRLGPNRIGWIEEEISAWMAARIAEREDG